MSKYLVIVESPSKAKTIKKFLGANYKVEASMGHLRDLPKSQLGVDIDNSFEPRYINIRGKGDLIKKLKKEAQKSERVFLATDPDREGEAISWHLSKILSIDENTKCRVTFNEITKDTVKKSIKQSREIDSNLVNAQQTRRILDRIVGYKISPLLWKNVKKGLSAGRVQSVALKLICDREEEIRKFAPEEYWTLGVQFLKNKKKFEAKFYGTKDEKIELGSKEDVDEIIKVISQNKFSVTDIRQSEKKKNTPPPFTTSALQQEAYKRLGFTAKKTMIIAQQLYEGIELEKGAEGLITYMRTDSTRVSDEAQLAAREYIVKNFGEKYKPKEPKKYKTKASAQDAHEAIRPTEVENSPDSVKTYLTPDQHKLYRLIWQRFLASQMENALYDTLSIDVQAGIYLFKISGSSIKFDGFLRVYEMENSEEENSDMPQLKIGEVLNCDGIIDKQHFTQPPARFTDASIVKILEEKGIGRPSTYVPIIETIIERGYVIREKKVLNPTELGEIVNKLVGEHFRTILNEEFTAGMEEKLDEIEHGKEDWKGVLREFYSPFAENLKNAEINMENVNYIQPEQESNVKCDKCGRNMVIKIGKYGKFFACPGFPECRNAKPYYEETGINCPKCGGSIVLRVSKKRIKYFSCLNEECKSVYWGKPIGEKCPDCGEELIQTDKYVKCNNSKCKYKKQLENSAKPESSNDE